MKIKTKTLSGTDLQDTKKSNGRINKCGSYDRVENSRRNGETKMKKPNLINVIKMERNGEKPRGPTREMN